MHGMIFIETPIFTKRIVQCVDDESYRRLQQTLMEHPDAGMVIRDSGGICKIRCAESI